MSFDFSSWIRGGAKRALTALAILAVLSLATPSAFASVSLSYKANGGAATALTSGVSTGNVVLGNFTYSLTATSFDSTSLDKLTSTTITLNNNSTTTDTLDLLVTGIGYNLGGTAHAGEAMIANFSVSGTGGPTDTTKDTTTAASWADTTNAAFGTNTPLGSLAGAPTVSGPLTSSYTFASGGIGPNVAFLLTGTTYSLTQNLHITLGGGDQANLTIITSATPAVPEPSSMAIAGLGALGLIGYGIRRRRGA